MSADNEICILELTDKEGHKEVRVADNVSMSYNLLSPEIDLTKNWQVQMVFNIWKDAKVFYHKLDAREFVNKLQEHNYYEYGSAWYELNLGWDEIVKLAQETKCKATDCDNGSIPDPRHEYGVLCCPNCRGTGAENPGDI